MQSAQGHRANDTLSRKGAWQSGVSASEKCLGYDAFGALLPGRNYSSDSYRFGFGGQEKDDEVNGATGTSYTAEFWQYDPRVARRWNLDPVPQIGISDYAAFGLNPISNVDPNGAYFFGLFGSTKEQRQSARQFASETDGRVKNLMEKSIHVSYSYGSSFTTPSGESQFEVVGTKQYFNPDGSQYHDCGGQPCIQAKVNDAWDDWSQSEGFIGQASYSFFDAAWLGLQGNPIGRTILGTAPVMHMDGQVANNNEVVEGAITSAPIPGLGMIGAGGRSITRAAEIAIRTERAAKWIMGNNKTPVKWANRMAKRGWTEQQITEAIQGGRSFPAQNAVNAGNGATRYVHPSTGRSVVIDDVTNEIIHVGGNGYVY